MYIYMGTVIPYVYPKQPGFFSLLSWFDLDLFQPDFFRDFRSQNLSVWKDSGHISSEPRLHVTLLYWLK